MSFVAANGSHLLLVREAKTPHHALQRITFPDVPPRFSLWEWCRLKGGAGQHPVGQYGLAVHLIVWLHSPYFQRFLPMLVHSQQANQPPPLEETVPVPV